jgi:hypothetical protein
MLTIKNDMMVPNYEITSDIHASYFRKKNFQSHNQLK